MLDEKSASIEPRFIAHDNGMRLAYRRTGGRYPGVLFLGGLRSDMNGAKALHIETVCQRDGRAFLRFEYTGHGTSDGSFEEGTIGQWLADARLVLDRLTQGPVVLVGSSLGGWLAILLALERPDRVAGILGISAAVDFTSHLHNVLFSDKHRAMLSSAGQVLVPDCHGGPPFAITQRLIEEAGEHLLLNRNSVPISCPVRLIHVRYDRDSAWDTGLRLADKLQTNDVKVIIVKDGEHQLVRLEDRLLQEQLLLELIAVAEEALSD